MSTTVHSRHVPARLQLLAVALLLAGGCRMSSGTATPSNAKPEASTAADAAPVTPEAAPRSAGEVRVLLDPGSIRFPAPAPKQWGTTVRFFATSENLIPPSHLDPKLEAGCACKRARVDQGVLRVRLEDARIVVDAMCGHIWHPVHDTPFLFQKTKTLDGSNPAAVDALLSIVRGVVEKGWSARAGCS